MRDFAAILAISAMSIGAAAHEMSPPGFLGTARAPAEYIRAPDTDDGFQHVVGEMASPSGLAYDEEVRIAAFLVLLQFGIARTARDVMNARSHRRPR